MESYEQAVDLALMVVNLDKTIFKTMINSGLVQYLNLQYPQVLKLNNQHEMNKFVLASKILLNDLQSIPVSNCPGRTYPNRMLNECDNQVNYKTPVFQEALIDPNEVTNSNVSRYLDGFNPNTFNPKMSRISQPLDTIGLYSDNSDYLMAHGSSIAGYGPEAKVRIQENFNSPTTHPIADTKNTYYSQYSRLFVNNNGEGYLDEESVNQINNEAPHTLQNYRRLHNGRFM
jgi:hypothetical protein